MKRFLFALTLVFAASAHAQDTGVDVAAITESATQFLTAAQNGDIAQTSQRIYTASGAQQPLAEAHARLVIAGRHLAEAAKTRFPGGDALVADALPNASNIVPEQVTQHDAVAEIRLSGRPLKLRRADGQWKVVLFPTDRPPATMQQLWIVNNFADAMNNCAAEIEAGKYAALADAKHAIQQQLGAVMAKAMVNDSATTRPATKPAPTTR